MSRTDIPVLPGCILENKGQTGVLHSKAKGHSKLAAALSFCLCKGQPNAASQTNSLRYVAKRYEMKLANRVAKIIPRITLKTHRVSVTPHATLELTF